MGKEQHWKGSLLLILGSLKNRGIPPVLTLSCPIELCAVASALKPAGALLSFSLSGSPHGTGWLPWGLSVFVSCVQYQAPVLWGEPSKLRLVLAPLWTSRVLQGCCLSCSWAN